MAAAAGGGAHILPRRALLPDALDRGSDTLRQWHAGTASRAAHSHGADSMKRAVVCGAGGFIASHLVKRLVRDGYWVRGVDIKEPEFAPTAADEFCLLDLRDIDQCRQALAPVDGKPVD